MIKGILYLLLSLGLLLSCSPSPFSSLKKPGRHYQKYQDYESLKQVVEGFSLGTDTSEIKKILGKPIDMGFDYRYLIDSTGKNSCSIGAVFHIGEGGKIDQKWIGEICE